MKEIYVGNLYHDVTSEDVRTQFAPYGEVIDIRLFSQRGPGHAHAFAFVEMQDADAERAILALDGMAYMGRTLRVEAAASEPVRL